MKILYAVQATGNGHITRARIMAEAFKTLNIEVDWVFSGRPKEELFDMEVFGNFKAYSGLTFAIDNGKIQYVKTIFKNNIFKFLRDLFGFRFDDYDLVINDFEPITAWAAKLRKVKTIGISHQMSFLKDIPLAGENFLAKLVLKNFAPVDNPIGLHWDHFNQDLLPPIVEEPAKNPEEISASLSQKEIIVYFPFCDVKQLIEWFAPFSNYNFHIFHGQDIPSGFNHIRIYSFSRTNFLKTQIQCGGVITAGGFELPSEAIQLGQKMLILPLDGQMEQQSNALALQQLKRATIAKYFSKEVLQSWLEQTTYPIIQYPKVAYELAKWLVNSESESLKSLSKRLWSQTKTVSNKNKKMLGDNNINTDSSSKESLSEKKLTQAVS